MEWKRCYNEVMQTCTTIALATSVEDCPNVRIVTFGYDPEQEGTLFFATFRGNRKTQEFSRNPQVACLPIPQGPETPGQVRIFGRVQASARTLQDMVALIEKKSPDDAKTLAEGGDLLEIYEVRFAEAWVTVGMSEAQRYRIGENCSCADE